MRKKCKYYVCDKKTNGVWFSSFSKEEAQEWVYYAPIKAQEDRSSFYIRRD